MTPGWGVDLNEGRELHAGPSWLREQPVQQLQGPGMRVLGREERPVWLQQRSKENQESQGEDFELCPLQVFILFSLILDALGLGPSHSLGVMRTLRLVRPCM